MVKRPNSNIMVKIIEDTEVILYKGTRLVIPTEKLQFCAIQWYHYYHQRSGYTRLEETIKPVMWWSNMRHHIRVLSNAIDVNLRSAKGISMDIYRRAKWTMSPGRPCAVT